MCSGAVFHNLDEESNIKYPLKLCEKYMYHLLLPVSYSKKKNIECTHSRN